MSQYHHTSDTTYDNLWAIGYFCVTTGTVTESVIREYIENQGKKESDEDKTFVVLG